MATRRRSQPSVAKPIVKASDWEKIQLEATASEELLTSDRFSFLRDYLETSKQSIIDHFVKNRIKSVDETVIAGNGSKTLHITRREQENELAGQYKFIEQLLADLHRFVAIPKEHEAAQERGEVEIEGVSEK